MFTTRNQDSNEWFIDSEESSHMTPYIENLDQALTHKGVEQVTVGNGNIISITYSRKETIETPIHNLYIHNLFHVPKA